MRRYAPKAKLYLHQPWAYEEGSSRLLDVAKYDNAERMLGDVVRVNSEIADLIGADGVIRSGELFGALQKRDSGNVSGYLSRLLRRRKICAWAAVVSNDYRQSGLRESFLRF